MTAEVFSSDDWEALVNAWTTAAQETQLEEEPPNNSSDDFIEMSHFLSEIQAKEHVTPLSLAVALLEHRLNIPEGLKVPWIK